MARPCPTCGGLLVEKGGKKKERLVACTQCDFQAEEDPSGAAEGAANEGPPSEAETTHVGGEAT